MAGGTTMGGDTAGTVPVAGRAGRGGATDFRAGADITLRGAAEMLERENGSRFTAPELTDGFTMRGEEEGTVEGATNGRAGGFGCARTASCGKSNLKGAGWGSLRACSAWRAALSARKRRAISPSDSEAVACCVSCAGATAGEFSLGGGVAFFLRASMGARSSGVRICECCKSSLV